MCDNRAPAGTHGMRAPNRLAIVLGLAAAATASAARVFAQEPAALVLSVSGYTTPEVTPYSEIPEGEMLTLRAGARLAFLHYHTCTRVTVNGGTVTIGADGYDLGGGAYQSHEKVACPVKLAVVGGMDAPITLERGDARDSMLTLAPGAAFVVLAERGRGFRAARVIENGATVREVRLDGSNFRWTDATAGMPPGALCTLEFLPTGAGKPAEIKFRIGPQSLEATDVIVYVR
jgi:hypothetical protein